MMLKGVIEKKLIEFEELSKQVKATKMGLKTLESLEEEIGKLLKEYLFQSPIGTNKTFMKNIQTVSQNGCFNPL